MLCREKLIKKLILNLKLNDTSGRRKLYHSLKLNNFEKENEMADGLISKMQPDGLMFDKMALLK
jgi:hypothetical protein